MRAQAHPRQRLIGAGVAAEEGRQAPVSAGHAGGPHVRTAQEGLSMTDFKAALAEFSARQAEREAQTQAELQHLKQAVIPCLRQAVIAKVEIRFTGPEIAVRSRRSSALMPPIARWLVPKRCSIRSRMTDRMKRISSILLQRGSNRSPILPRTPPSRMGKQRWCGRTARNRCRGSELRARMQRALH